MRKRDERSVAFEGPSRRFIPGCYKALGIRRTKMPDFKACAASQFCHIRGKASRDCALTLFPPVHAS
jgi:hypothetical protein